MLKKKALVVGATGIIGSYILDHLSLLDDWEAIGVARTIPDKHPERYVSLNLLDAGQVKETLGRIRGITHIFFAAYQDFPIHSKEQVEVNTGMLANAVKGVEATSSSLERVVLMQGAKVYGAHLGKFKTPAKETDPRHLPPNFYYSQEDFLRSHQQGKSWSWTILRPDLVAGVSIGNPMSIAMVIAVYASISKELGLPLRFPGKEGAYRALVQLTDASLLARASAWAATQEHTAFEVFNITNGDLFRWENLWPKIAGYFNLEAGPVQPIPLSELMPLQKETWTAMIEKYGLLPVPYEKVAAWPFGDFIFGAEYDVITDTTKIKQFGFHEVLNTEEELFTLLDELKKQRLIP
ncbi:Nucleoside-diphosphate-sugar epimerase [Paenibacillus tianmuensis]|uniref:Nucleoside-diphosphate-sugar epimerase n=1 Tax=Paenibacillus tianmuensis TaxID=624147 RepID=A0A1G4TFD0_9BACL|nr:SDR family oxidoreductase [Paenibacillus tianmuensis]SCW79289.1 Nucleoside-diphosphate-sugar epimerase [Paenibacillus tianmuensis]